MPTDDAKLPALRAKTHAEIVADIARERSQVETGLSAGLIALVLAIGNLMLMTLLNRTRK